MKAILFLTEAEMATIAERAGINTGVTLRRIEQAAYDQAVKVVLPGRNGGSDQEISLNNLEVICVDG